MTGYLAGRIEAFDGLYAALAPRIRSYLLGQCRDASLADDLVQETFMQLHRSRRTYEAGRPVTPWVFAIARHVFLMHRRSGGRRLRFHEAFSAEIRSGDIPHDEVRALADRDEVRRALDGIPADQRRALVMHHVEGWSFAEIASRLGIRVNAAKTRAFRGMRKLKKQIGTD
jgi:RNA polymerase sigma-70 factor (ECF subfamily)